MPELSKIIDFFSDHGQSTTDVTVKIVRTEVNIVVDTTRVCAVVDFGSRPWSATIAAERRGSRLVTPFTSGTMVNHIMSHPLYVKFRRRGNAAGISIAEGGEKRKRR